MISRSDIIEAIRMQGERIKKGLGYRRDLLSSLSPLLQDYALIILFGFIARESRFFSWSCLPRSCE